jgi:hypothetical protein
MPWIKSDEPMDALVWMPDERTASTAERNTRIGVDLRTGDTHLTFIDESGEATVVKLPPVVAGLLGARLIEAGVLGSGPR